MSLAIALPVVLVYGGGALTASPSRVEPAAVRTAPAPAVARGVDGDRAVRRAVASRVLVPTLGIDLPVVSGNLQVPGNPGRYPLCDVAQYLTSYGQPGEGRTTYLYAHARKGMFLPLLQGSRVEDGAAMIGALVEVQTDGGDTYVYEIFQVKRHAIDFSLADEVGPHEERLVMQTSEGPPGTRPKLQVAARLLGLHVTPKAVAPSVARPRSCAPDQP